MTGFFLLRSGKRLASLAVFAAKKHPERPHVMFLVKRTKSEVFFVTFRYNSTSYPSAHKAYEGTLCLKC